MGRSFIVYVKDTIWWCPGKSLQIENTCFCATQNCIRSVRHGDLSEDIDAQLSKIDNDGEKSLDQKLRLRNFDARHRKIETGAVVISRKGSSGGGTGKGICYQWKEKGQCSKGDQCSFRHESDDRAPKPEHDAATLSEPTVSRGRSPSRKRSARGRSQTGRILRQLCRYYSKGTCTR